MCITWMQQGKLVNHLVFFFQHCIFVTMMLQYVSVQVARGRTNFCASHKQQSQAEDSNEKSSCDSTVNLVGGGRSVESEGRATEKNMDMELQIGQTGSETAPQSFSTSSSADRTNITVSGNCDTSNNTQSFTATSSGIVMI